MTNIVTIILCFMLILIITYLYFGLISLMITALVKDFINYYNTNIKEDK